MTRQISFESLEQRNLMSVSIINNAVTVSGDDFNVVRNDAIVLRRSPLNPINLEVFVNGQLQLSRSIATIASLQINGRGGDDTLSIRNSNDTITLLSGQALRFDGGAGSNTVIVSGSGAQSSGIFESATANTGDVSKTVNGQFQRLTFSSVATVRELTTATSFRFVGVASGTETITLDNGASDSDGILQIRHSIVGKTFANVEFANKAELTLDSDQGSAAVQFPPDAIVLTVNGGDRDLVTLRNSEIVGVPARIRVLTHQGADVVKIEGQNAPIDLNTGTGNDIIIVGKPGPLSSDATQDGGVATKTLNAFFRDITITDTPDPFSLSGSAGSTDTDILTVDDGGDTTDNVGELTATTISGLGLGTRISYSGMETVNMQLGSAKDTLNARNTALNVSYNVNGGAGGDLLRLGSRGTGSAAGGGTVNGIRGTVTFNGGAGINSIVLDDSGDTANNTGNLIPGRLSGMGMADILFSSVSRVNVFCGSGDDTFINQILPGGAITVQVDLGAGEA